MLLTPIGCGAADEGQVDATYVALRATYGSETIESPTAVTTPTEQSVAPTATATSEPTNTLTPESEPSATPTVAATPTSAPLIAPIIIQGTNTETTGPLHHANRLMIVTSRASGTGIFQVIVRDTATDRASVVASGQAPYQGSSAIMPRGPIEIVVTANGEWEVELSFPSAVELPVYAAPYATAGSGDQAVYFLQLWPGEHIVSATHAGSGPFAVSLVELPGGATTQLITSQGASQGSSQAVSEAQPYGLYAINVRASGDWTLTVR